MRKILSLAIVLVLVLVVVTGCRRDDGPTEHSQGVTDTHIYVGNTAAASGPFAFVGVPFLAGMEAYFAVVNEAGGVHGRQINFIHHDDGFEAPRGIAATEQLIHDDRVFAIVGHFGTPTIGATLSMLRESGIPVVYFAAGLSELFNDAAFTPETGQRLFPVQPLFRPEGHVLVARAVDEYDARRIGIIFSNDDAGQDLISGARTQVAELGAGFELIERQVNPGDAGSVSPAVLAMYAENVDVIIIGTLQDTFPMTVNAIVAQGLNVPVFTSYISADATAIMGFMADYVGAGATFPIYSTAWLDIFNHDAPADDPLLGFVPDYWDFANAVGEDFMANAFAMAGWIAASTFVQGMRHMGDAEFITWEGLTYALENNLIHLPMGGIMDFSGGQRTGTTSMSLLRANVNLEAPEWAHHRALERLEDTISRAMGQ
jgi:ABC-type branched-subunit amino acid transport system substrate-binding protein